MRWTGAGNIQSRLGGASPGMLTINSCESSLKLMNNAAAAKGGVQGRLGAGAVKGPIAARLFACIGMI